MHCFDTFNLACDIGECKIKKNSILKEAPIKCVRNFLMFNVKPIILWKSECCDKLIECYKTCDKKKIDCDNEFNRCVSLNLKIQSFQDRASLNLLIQTLYYIDYETDFNQTISMDIFFEFSNKYKYYVDNTNLNVIQKHLEVNLELDVSGYVGINSCTVLASAQSELECELYKNIKSNHCDCCFQ